MAMLMALILSFHAWAAQASSNFEVADLSSLKLADIGDFWKDDNPEVRLDRSGANFQHEATYLGGLSYHGKIKTVEVAVFKSEGDALNAMEALRADVALVIEPGETNAFAGSRWWFASGIPNGVFVMCNNTIVTVACYRPPYEQSKGLLHDAARVVLERIQRRIEAPGRIGDAQR